MSSGSHGVQADNESSQVDRDSVFFDQSARLIPEAPFSQWTPVFSEPGQTFAVGLWRFSPRHWFRTVGPISYNRSANDEVTSVCLTRR